MERRHTYVVSLYGGERSIVVEAVQRDERARLDDLDGLAERIRRWEDPDGRLAREPGADDARVAPDEPNP